MTKTILTLNIGSSTVKLSVFEIGAPNEEPKRLYRGLIDHVPDKPVLSFECNDSNPTLSLLHDSDFNEKNTYEAILQVIIEKINKHYQPVAVGHRVVHGGERYHHPIVIESENLRYLETLIPLALLHQPYNLRGIQLIQTQYPEMLQVACFDTAFHHTCHSLSQTFALPKALTDAGIRKYGFHGLSYQSIVSKLDRYLPAELLDKKIIIAHLGSGASMCAIQQRKSVSTSMGFSVLDGLPMSTRCGSIDPGVLLYLLQQKGMTGETLSHLLHKESGLLGVSNGLSSDARVLLQTQHPDAKRAIDLFVYQVNRWLGTLTAELQGLDALIFTGGIGEHLPAIRQQIVEYARWLGMVIDPQKNNQNNQELLAIHAETSKIPVYVIATDEEQIIAEQTVQLCANYAII